MKESDFHGILAIKSQVDLCVGWVYQLDIWVGDIVM